MVRTLEYPMIMECPHNRFGDFRDCLDWKKFVVDPMKVHDIKRAFVDDFMEIGGEEINRLM